MVDVEASSVHLFETVSSPKTCGEMLVGKLTIDDFLNGDERICHYVAIYNDRVIGYVSYYVKENNVLWITNIYTHSDFQGCRVGGSLLSFVEELAVEDGIDAIALETQKKMTWAIDFYMKHNYKLLSWEDLNTNCFIGTRETHPEESICTFGKVL